MRALAPLAVLIAALALPGHAQAEKIVLRDDEGRPITFDGRAADVDVEWHANLLRRAAHGDEIGGVTIRIVEPDDVRRRCGPGAGGCYRGGDGRGTITLPAGEGSTIAHTLIHEYGHHLDYSIEVPGVPEPDGTPSWWRARGMSDLLAQRRVAFDYSLGWSHATGEIFAEDYARLHLRLPYRIGWLSPPGPDVRAALRRDLEGVPAAPSNPPPLVIERSGVLEPGAVERVPFGLLGPGRRVTFTVWLEGMSRRAPRARLQLVCDRSPAAVATLGQSRLSATIDRRNLGPDRCHAVLRSTSGTPHRYAMKLRLAVEGGRGFSRFSGGMP